MEKIRRVLLYFSRTLHLVTTLSTNKLNVVKWWVGRSYATHPNMGGHTSSTVLLGQGSVFSSSTKQKLNTKSSTETELIAIDDAMPHIIWTTYFLECQGYNIGKAQIFQDNMSAMLLEKNGKWSSRMVARNRK
eukprot:5879911-Ditylum_brightwellii.AAC.1